jgi:hypothetical protein
MSGEPMTAPKTAIAQQFYHGTRADVKPGGLIQPGFSSNYGKRKQASWVYLTGTLDAAIWGAELAVGEGHPTLSYRSREPLRVVGEVAEWEGHSPERRKEMKDHLERLRQLGVEAID